MAAGGAVAEATPAAAPAAAEDGTRAAEDGLPPADSGEAAYGLAVEPAQAFSRAREATASLHEALGRLKAARAGAGDSFLSAPPGFLDAASDLQVRLLGLRRAHRAMASAVDAGRSEEAAARRAADAEFAHLETRRYESACCRAAARRCRTFPTPRLSKLRPVLEGAAHIGEDQEEQGCGDVGALSSRLEAERVERERLSAELEQLERGKAAQVDKLLEAQRSTNDIAEKLRAVERALEPVCELLDLRRRPAASPRPGEEGLAGLPGPLRLVFNKFDVLATYGAGEVSVRTEIPDGPAEKRQRLASGESAPVAGAAVVVEISVATEGDSKQPTAAIRFTCPHPQLVAAAGERDGSDALLASLWPQEEATAVPEGVALPSGQPFSWVQVLCGLRERSLSAIPAPLLAEGVTASDVVQRVRERLAGKQPS